jgi:hypothetical protein
MSKNENTTAQRTEGRTKHFKSPTVTLRAIPMHRRGRLSFATGRDSRVSLVNPS